MGVVNESGRGLKISRAIINSSPLPQKCLYPPLSAGWFSACQALGFLDLVTFWMQNYGHHLDHASDGVVTLSPTERSIPRYTGRSATDTKFKKVGDI